MQHRQEGGQRAVRAAGSGLWRSRRLRVGVTVALLPWRPRLLRLLLRRCSRLLRVAQLLPLLLLGSGRRRLVLRPLLLGRPSAATWLLLLLLGLLPFLALAPAALLAAAAADRALLQFCKQGGHGGVCLSLPPRKLLLVPRWRALAVPLRADARAAGLLPFPHALPLLQAPQRLGRSRVALLQRSLRAGWGRGQVSAAGVLAGRAPC